MVDSVLWRCARCGGEFIGGRTPDDLCTACIAAALTRPALTGDLSWERVTVTADGATTTTGTRELRIPLPGEYEAAYAARSGVTVADLHRFGRYAEPCGCGGAGCEGWAMGHQHEDALSEDTWRRP